MNKNRISSHQRQVAKDVVNRVKSQWGQGWNFLSPKQQLAYVDSELLGYVFSANVGAAEDGDDARAAAAFWHFNNIVRAAHTYLEVSLPSAI